MKDRVTYLKMKLVAGCCWVVREKRERSCNLLGNGDSRQLLLGGERKIKRSCDLLGNGGSRQLLLGG